MSLPHPRVAELDDEGEPSDAELIAAARLGDGDAYGQLYERHHAAARHLARQLCRDPADVDDLVADSFARVLDALRSGGGPETAFRAYLLTTLRNARYARLRRDRKLQLSDDMSRHDPGTPWDDPAVAVLETTLAARAFARLPERWQTVLWHTEVEQDTPAHLASRLGLTPNGVAALAYRAREGLRQAYLREHLTNPLGGRHRWTVERLGGWARSGLTKRERAKVDDHLAGCERCRLLAEELTEVNGSLRGLLAAVFLAGPAAVAQDAATAGAGGIAATAGAGGAGGSMIGTLAGWVGSTTAGKAAAAAATAMVVSGTAVSVGVLDPSPGLPLGAAPAAAAPAAVTPPPSAGPTADGSAGPPATGAAGPGRRAGPGATPGRPTPTGDAERTGPTAATGPVTPAEWTSAGQPPRGSKPSRSGQVATGPAVLEADPPVPVGPLVLGRPGEIEITVRNSGGADATGLVAIVTLPTGLAVRAGSGGGPANWRCSGTDRSATCAIATLPAGGSGTIRLDVTVAADAAAGRVTGELAGPGGLGAAIPAATVQPQAAAAEPRPEDSPTTPA